MAIGIRRHDVLSDRRLLALLHLCDSLFPTGGYAHSDGLETAAVDGRVATADDLQRWLEVWLREPIARCDGLAVVQTVMAVAERRWADVIALDGEVHALRPSSAGRAASRSIGTRLLKTWQAIHADAEADFRLATAGSMRATLPVAFGIVAGWIGITGRVAVEAFTYTRLAAIASCAMRLLPIGQQEAHARLASVLSRVPAVVADIERRLERRSGPAAFAPELDLAAMGVRSRLFLS